MMTPGQTEANAPAGISAEGFAVRLMTGAAYATVMVAGLWFGRYSAGVLLGLLAGAAVAEFYALARRDARLPNEMFGITAAAAMPVCAAAWGASGLSAALTALIVGSLVWHLLNRRMRTADTAITLFGAVYVGFLLAYLVLILRTFEQGRELALVLLASVWAADVFAYLVGSTIGRHRLAPHISPKKSWEGFIAGTLATIGVWAAAVRLPILGEPVLAGVSDTTTVLVGCAVAVAALVGDLVESRIKREAGVKDSGTALPGHGGFLDRLDSLIAVGVVAFWVLWWSGVR